MRRYTATLSVVVTLAVLAVALRAGPLDPPAGPITPTYKTLTEVEPRTIINSANTHGDGGNLFRITQPGSYYLTGNITGVSGKNGIQIEAGGVTLDLNGFDLVGVPGSVDGVNVIAGGLKNITVLNGSVRSWGQVGIDIIGNSSTTNCRLADLLAVGNGFGGIIAAYGTTIDHCVAGQNGGEGISTGENCTVTDCTAYANNFSGISVLLGSTISGCTASLTSGAGISAGNACTIVGCTVQGNSSDGISLGTACSISQCTVYNNGDTGILTGNGCTIAGCTCRANTTDGILVDSGCLVQNNDCTTNGSGGSGAGIHAAGGNNRIQDNNCTSADRGIEMSAAGNFLVRNTCASNTTNWVLAANNVFGPIIDRRSPASAAVSGNSAASSLGSTDSNANFSY